MNNKTRVATVIIAIVIVLVSFGFRAAIRPKVSADPSTYTKQQYLDGVKNNGGGDLEMCAYSGLIDELGVKEVYRIDLRAISDEFDERVARHLLDCLDE